MITKMYLGGDGWGRRGTKFHITEVGNQEVKAMFYSQPSKI